MLAFIKILKKFDKVSKMDGFVHFSDVEFFGLAN